MGKKYSVRKKESLAHYRRMIKWAKTQAKNRRPSAAEMSMDIDEEWNGDNCQYCRAHDGHCAYCQLDDIKSGCCSGLWKKMYDAKSWAKWIYWAERIVQYIKNNG